MENISLLEKIKSKYITEIIKSYTSDNYIMLKLFNYSKYYHKKLKIDLFFFQENFFNKRIKWDNYLCTNDIFSNSFELKEDFKKKLLYYSLDDGLLAKIVINYFSNKLKEKELLYDQKLNIAFFSPLLDILSKANFFQDLFTIKFSGDTYLSEKEYNYFNEFNNFNNYSLNIFFDDGMEKNIKHLMFNHSQINFKKVNNLEISIKYSSESQFFYQLFNKILPSKELIYLSLSMNKDFHSDSKSFEFINTFKSLKTLILQNITFIDVFRLKINTLKKLSLKYIKNIIIEKITCLTLKNLNLEFSAIIFNNKEGEINLPELEEIDFCSVYVKDNTFINFKSLKQLKRYKGKNNYFLLIQSPLLEEIVLEDNIINFKDLKQIIEKICPLKYLTKINLNLRLGDRNAISEIFGNNESIKEINVKFSNENDQRIFYHIQNSFLNLTNLDIELNNIFIEEGCEKQFEFIESPISKVKNIHLIINQFSCFKILCQSFTNLESIRFETWGLDSVLNNLFPILSDKCKIIFNSLKTFELLINAVEINSDILENIYNNIDNMPNLVNFKLVCKPKEISGKFRKLFLKKIFTLKYIRRIYFKILKYKYINKQFSVEDLMEIFPEVNFKKFYDITIIDDIAEFFEGKEDEIEKYYKNEKKDENIIIEAKAKENSSFFSDYISQILRKFFG